ncbi:bifunctional diaminohydroxyphosphoribosylaminopyrimidine deaminase/5-amino-6-(5-phosphoribosylamino)uracil reductase RibD [bacterium]|nr:bifunctional diaminohydroxyphosphoribosylaminopyrimidine deaminase/5-amino-6-(5-phosphoribosylamino)uracil reductase RibD [bacterium]
MKTNFSDLDFEAMSLALELSKKGLGQVSPNPMVGAVIVKDSKIIATGYHKAFGADHAEVDAIKNAREDLHGASIYVSLEPCHHYGKTPPCTQAILNAGIKRVVCAVLDPNPKAQGGLDYLGSQGISCESGLLTKEAIEINKVFFINQTKKRPKITLKLAQTLNGKICREDGSSQWITGEEARLEVHKMRSQHSAIFVGNATLMQDNPSLNVRHCEGEDPVIIIIDVKASLSPDLKVFQAKKVIYYSQKMRTDLASHIDQENILGDLDYQNIWQKVLGDLYKKGLDSLYVEGGSQVSSFLLAENLIDELYLFFGMKYFPTSGKDAFTLTEDKEFILLEKKEMGDSLLLRGDFGCLQALLKNLGA